MRKRRFELLTAPLMAAMGGAVMVADVSIKTAIVGWGAVVFSYFWSKGYFTDCLADDGPELKEQAIEQPKYEGLKYKFRKGA